MEPIESAESEDEDIVMKETQFLKFEDWQTEISRNNEGELWTTVYDYRGEGRGDYATFSGLLPNKTNLISRVLGDSSWDIQIGYGHPGFWKEGKDQKVHYSRFGNMSSEVPFESLVIHRSFFGLWEEYLELSEEFRLYHNLCHDRRSNELRFLAQTGEDDVVARIDDSSTGSRIRIKTRYLRDFLAAKSMVLVRFHDHRRYSTRDLGDALGNDVLVVETTEPDFCFTVAVNPKPRPMLDKWKAFSRFLGKDILLPRSEPSHEGYRSLKGEREKKYVDFIIETDKDGEPAEHNCNPSILGDFFGGNPEAPHYLTPVFFKREVLRMYYDKPSKYSVEDNYLRCGYLWGMRYGQNPLGLVHAWLGDLGRDLPHNEQLQWRNFNIPPEGRLGKATVKRELMAEFAYPDELTHIFKYELGKFSELWRTKFGWDLFLPLRDDDEHYLKSLHIPTSEDPLEFDQQVLALSKVLCDSINVDQIKKTIVVKEKGIKRRFGIKGFSGIGSIYWLKAMLVFHLKQDDASSDEIIQSLKTIQSLRSKGVAHRKGKGYDKAKKALGLDEDLFVKFLGSILENTVRMFRQLETLLSKDSNTDDPVD